MAFSTLKVSFKYFTMYPLFKEAASSHVLRLNDVEHLSNMVSARSNAVITGLLAILGFIFSNNSYDVEQGNTKSSGLLLPFVVLIWSLLNRAYYENLPPEEFQKRIRSSTPELVTMLYTVPEMYQMALISVEVLTAGGWRFAVLIIVPFTAHLLVRRIGRTLIPT
ncbi:hypothetical protein DL96DRAFT_1689606 [Flagelloscypha sp. PMI_526]|nr:hypothetical protein DL96DRAFT_1689606 [Flagelloscypha sp. PMI_526]